MKERLILTLSIVMLAVAGVAQNYSTMIHHGSDTWRLHQCYNIIEASDGSVIVGENLYDEDLWDVGKYLYKLDSEAQVTDSVFTFTNTVNSVHPVLRDPFNDDNNIITSFYEENGNNYFSRVCFNDNLEITEVSEKQIEIPGLWNSYGQKNYLVNGDHDIVVHGSDTDSTEMFFVFGLDGETKYVSEPVRRTDRWLPNQSLFTISDTPRRYGMLKHTSNCNEFVEVFDDRFQRLGEHVIPKINGYQTYGGLYFQAVGVDDGCFLVTSEMFKVSPNGIMLHARMIIKFNSDFEVTATHTIESGEEDMISYRNIAVTDDGRVYFVWLKAESGIKRSIVVDCLDTDLNLEWERVCHTEPNADCFGMQTLSNGGLAICGQGYTNIFAVNEVKDFFVVIFDDEGWSVNENCNAVPFLCYPNPASNTLHVDISPDVADQVSEISLFDISGRLVKAQQSGFGSIDISGLAPGMYVMKVALDGGKVFEEKIVKK
ncbi:MAG: T9SS type A sorting domain-containing protein [Bacteroidales bacterium]|nr:T9SS type A sorting domain-containing protein [Bacteroidales bacterium]